MHFRRYILCSCLAIMLPALGGCGEDGLLADPEGRTITVTLRNQDTQAAHLFTDAETFPCCRVEPGATRSATIIRKANGGFNVSAGRNGVALVGLGCTVTQANFDSRTKSVTFLGNGWACGS